MCISVLVSSLYICNSNMWCVVLYCKFCVLLSAVLWLCDTDRADCSVGILLADLILISICPGYILQRKQFKLNCVYFPINTHRVKDTYNTLRTCNIYSGIRLYT